MDDFLHLREQGGLLSLQRLEGVEQGIDDDRLQKEEHQQDRNGRKPEVEPPSAWAAPDDGIKDRDQQRSHNQHQDLVQDPVAQPRSPALHGEAIGVRQGLIPNVGRNSEDGNGQENQGREDDHLHAATHRDAFGQVAKRRRQPPSQDDQQQQETIKGIDEEVAIMGVRIRFRASVLGWRRRVLDDGRAG